MSSRSEILIFNKHKSEIKSKRLTHLDIRVLRSIDAEMKIVDDALTDPNFSPNTSQDYT